MEEYLIENNTMFNTTEEIAITEESLNAGVQFVLGILVLACILIFLFFLGSLILILILLCCSFYFDGWEGIKIGISHLMHMKSNASNKESNNNKKSNLRYLTRNTKIDRTPDPITSSPDGLLDNPTLETITNYFVLPPELKNQLIRQNTPPEQNDIGFVQPPESANQSNQPSAPP
ncbi:hypothetical protein NEIRO03_1663 [Nematocida sp. AWRm78]|nr:hypothetical protein NEIRO02_1725 [Nematocida sp. AWRm79]KAI5184209.1 hypothetical protein NEIRO03_1663 [Nematocida sp. AWRm78]